MIVRTRRTKQRDGGGEDWRLSDGEVHHLWWFIQGSIMVPDIRWKLRRAWGFCERHAWGALLGEASFRHGYLHGPAILYADLIGRALDAFDVHGPWQARRVASNLRETAPCFMCDLGLARSTRGAARERLIEEGRDPRALAALAAQTHRCWRPTLCGRCAGSPSGVRCRRHFRDDVRRGIAVDVGEQRQLLEGVARHLSVYSRSFVFGHHGTDGPEDRAALLSAVGWCSGWRGLLALCDATSDHRPSVQITHAG